MARGDIEGICLGRMAMNSSVENNEMQPRLLVSQSIQTMLTGHTEK
jgi:hypothetical protein